MHPEHLAVGKAHPVSAMRALGSAAQLTQATPNRAFVEAVTLGVMLVVTLVVMLVVTEVQETVVGDSVLSLERTKLSHVGTGIVLHQMRRVFTSAMEAWTMLPLDFRIKKKCLCPRRMYCSAFRP